MYAGSVLLCLTKCEVPFVKRLLIELFVWPELWRSVLFFLLIVYTELFLPINLLS